MKLTCVLFCLLLVWRAEADKTVYIGGYDKVITVLNLNTTAQQFQLLYQVPALQNPCFLVMDPSKKYLYAVSEVEEYDGKKTGAIVAYNVDPTSKILTPLNARDSLGGGPVTLQVSKDSKYMLVANYMGPTFAVFELAGRIGNSTFVQENKGHGPNPERQEMAHPHQLIFDPAEKYAFGCDLGNDKVYQFSFDQGKLVPHPTTPTIDQKPGSGPRHIAFHPNLKNAYLVHELDNTLTIFDYESGSLTEKRVISTLPRGSDPKSTYPAEVYVTKDGKYLYMSNRGLPGTQGSNTIGQYKVKPDGDLELVEFTSALCTFPRLFVFDESDQILIVACQFSNNIVAFTRNSDTGKLSRLAEYDAVTAPAGALIV